MEVNFLSIIYRFHSVTGFLQFSPALHLQYLQQLTPATLQGHTFLRAHLPHFQKSLRFAYDNFRNNEIVFSFKAIIFGVQKHCSISKWGLNPQLHLVVTSFDMHPNIRAGAGSFHYRCVAH